MRTDYAILLLQMVEVKGKGIIKKISDANAKYEQKHGPLPLSNRTSEKKIDEMKKVQLDEKCLLYEVSRNTFHTIPTTLDRIKDTAYQRSSVTESLMTQDRDDNELSSEAHQLESQKVLFANLDRCVEKSIMSHKHVLQEFPLQSLKEFTRLCLTGVVLVFTSLNPSGTARLNTVEEMIPVPDENLEKSSTISNELDQSIRSINGAIGLGGKTSQKQSKVAFVNHNPFIQRHQQRLSTLNSNSLEIENIIPIIPVKQEEEEKKSEEDSEDEFILDDKQYEEKEQTTVDGDKSLHRPSLPIPVVQLLWHKIAEEYFLERESGINLELLLGFIQDLLVNDLAFLELIHSEYDDEDLQERQSSLEDQNAMSRVVSIEGNDEQNPKEQKSCPQLTDGGNLPSDENGPSVRCLRITHDIHMLYARNIARNDRSLLSFFKKEKLLKNICLSSKYSKLATLDENEKWNPEVALNFMMSVACSSCIDSCSNIGENKETMSAQEKLQYEYSLEMLPWHLMRSTHYNAVVDVLTSASFVKARCSFLDFEDAANLHINDAEELLYNIATILQAHPSEVIDLDMNEILVESYRLLAGILHHEDAQTTSDQARDVDDNLNPTSIYALKVSQALQALGDSLLRHDQQKGAIKFYYRALMR